MCCWYLHVHLKRTWASVWTICSLLDGKVCGLQPCYTVETITQPLSMKFLYVLTLTFFIHFSFRHIFFPIRVELIPAIRHTVKKHTLRGWVGVTTSPGFMFWSVGGNRSHWRSTERTRDDHVERPDPWHGRWRTVPGKIMKERILAA